MHITIRQLQVFASVAKHLSYTRAAEELHLTQPAVSMQIKQLEKSVGLNLFEQIGKKIYLTEAGNVVLEHAISITSKLKSIENDLEQLKGIDGGRLTVCIASTVNYFATRLISRFSQAYPSVQISLDVTNRHDLLKRLESNEPDLVLMDLVMPEKDGLSAIKDIISKDSSAKIIVCSADIQVSINTSTLLSRT